LRELTGRERVVFDEAGGDSKKGVERSESLVDDL
jgi:hypothetical protein